MKHLKLIGVAAIAAMALMAFASTASATVTSPSGTEYTGEVKSTASSSLLLEAGFAEITCTESTVAGKITTNDATIASGAITTLSYSNCGSATVDTLANGSLEIVSAGSGKGTVKGYNSQVTTSIFGTSCVYGTAAGGTTLGTVVGGTPAKMTISASLPKISGGFLCANPAKWSGSYTVTTPSTLLID
jgi:hypothetical protein